MRVMSPAFVAERLQRWRSAAGPMFADLDSETRALCEAALANLCDASLLSGKLACELGDRRWRGLGRILVVASENDVLGTAFALVGACLTGNEVVIKARKTESLVKQLKAALELSNEDCSVLDWSSAKQDDRAVFDGIDGIVLAGSEDLIRHYRRVAPAFVRLIEYGPKLSCAIVGGDEPIAGAVDELLRDMSLFGQRVCSSPLFVLVDGSALGAKLFDLVAPRLHELAPLEYEARLTQYSRYQELIQVQRIEGRGAACHLDLETGWGATLSSGFDPGGWLPRGLQIVTGDLLELLRAVNTRYRRHLQSAGIYGLSSEARAAIVGFTRVCPIGTMHQRSFLEPHDGMLELPALVEFLS